MSFMGFFIFRYTKHPLCSNLIVFIHLTDKVLVSSTFFLFFFSEHAFQELLYYLFTTFEVILLESLSPLHFYFSFPVSFTPAISMKITLHRVVDGVPCLVRHCTRPRGLNTVSAEVCSLHSQQEHNSSISGFLLPGQSMSMCLPASCAPLSSQAERMINYTKLLHADYVLLFMLYRYILKKDRRKALGGVRECLWIWHIC